MDDGTTRAQKCRHTRGDMVSEIGLWVCADCYEKLSGWPVKYGPTGGGGPPQNIAWRAEKASSDGISFAEFLCAMSCRYMMRTRPRMQMRDAYDAAIEYLRWMLPDAYGDTAYSWDRDAAVELADDDMQDWDQAEDKSNG